MNSEPKFDYMTEVYINCTTEEEFEVVGDYHKNNEKVIIGYPKYSPEYDQYIYLISGCGSILESACSLTPVNPMRFT